MEGIIYNPDFFNHSNYIFEDLLETIDWDDKQFARKECFMSDEAIEYQYIENGPIYKSKPFDLFVKAIMSKINENYGYNLNVCFINYYEDHTKALGWHADDAKEINQNEPIAVVSFGEPREIWWKPMDYKGNIPKDWKQLLGDGSLFIMPPGMQDSYFHKIPKGDREMGGRISLTYRSWKF